MMTARVIKDSKIKELKQLIIDSENIVITCHVSPDGDAIGSTLAMCHILRAMGKDARIVTPDLPPKTLMFLPGARDIVVFTRNADLGRQLFFDTDLVLCLDFNSPYRVDKMADTMLQSQGKKVLIDHHLDPDKFADLVISHPEMSSTCLLVYKIICQLGLSEKIDRNVADCIYTGMMTDTGNFTYNSEDPDIYLTISELLKKGINKDRLYSRVCNTNSESRIRLIGYALSQKMQLFPEHHAALIALTQDELKQFKYEKGDTESLVNIPLSIPDISYSIFLRDDVDYIKVSARSVGNFPVNRICEKHFGGGGHKNAAGGEFRGSVQEAIDKFISILDENDIYFK